MPNYEANCPEGHPFTAFQSYADYDLKIPLVCPTHLIEGSRLISKPNVGGTSSFQLGHTEAIRRELEHQLGVPRDSIRSSKEVDEICAKKGLAMVDKDWQPPASIIKNREEAGLEKMAEGMMKELSQHSEVILPDGSTKSLGL